MARTILALPFDGERLREQRERAGLSRAALAKACAASGKSVSPQHLGRLEQNQFRPYPKLLATLAEVLDVQIDDLLSSGQTP